MPYHRDLIFKTPLLTWQNVTLTEEQDSWSVEHRVDAARLVLPVTRCFDCRLGTSSFTCDPLSALWLTPEQGYRMRHPWRNQRSWLIVVDAPFEPARRASVSAHVQARLLQWHAAHLAGQLENLQLEERLSTLIHAIVPPESRPSSRPHRAVERTKEYLASAPERDDTMTEIAGAVHCSPFHLARLFRRQTGTSLHRYRTALRMTQALARLSQGESDLSRLAADLGYASHSHFTSVFRRTFDTTPNQMRRNLTAPHLAI